MKYKILFSLFATGVAFAGWSQKPSDFRDKYEGEVAVRLEEHTHVELEVDDGEIKINRSSFIKTYMASAQLNGVNKVSLDYEPLFSKISDIEAHTLIPNFEKDKFGKEKVRDIIDRKVLDDDIFHDGTRAKSFEFQGVKKGGITQLEYTEEISEPRLIGREVFSSSLLTLNKSLSIEYDEEIDLAIDYFNCDSSWFEIERNSSRGKITLTWRKKNIQALQEESNQPPYLEIAPHLIYRIKSYKNDDDEYKVLGDIDDLYDWYGNFISNQEELSTELKSITDSLTANKVNDISRAKSIYDWVNNAIRYIAFEEGLGGFKPRAANLVCERRYGDCKDMANLMVSMMQYAGLKAHHVWVGTRDLPYTYQQVPSVLADNHMIAALHHDGKYYFLDATHKALPFPYPSMSVQGKDALIGLSATEYLVKKIPVVASERNLDRDTVLLSLEGDQLNGKGFNTLHGYNAQRFNRLFEQKDRKTIDKVIESAYSKGNNKCQAQLIDYERGDTVSQLRYAFNIPQYAYQLNDKLYLNLNLEKVFENLAQKSDREHPLHFERTFLFQRVYRLEIPDGYQLEHLPQAVQNQFDGYGYSISYHQPSQNTVEYALEIDLNRLKINKEELNAWNEFIAELKKAYSETIILKKV